jgi:hypothetical protein
LVLNWKCHWRKASCCLGENVVCHQPKGNDSLLPSRPFIPACIFAPNKILNGPGWKVFLPGRSAKT